MLLLACAVPSTVPDDPAHSVAVDTAVNSESDSESDSGSDSASDTATEETAIEDTDEPVSPGGVPCPDEAGVRAPGTVEPATSLCFGKGDAGVDLAVADVDGDGHRDLLVGTGTQNGLYVFFEDLPAGSPDSSVIATFLVGQADGAIGAGMAAADLDQDGRVDLALGDSEGSTYFDDGVVTVRTLTPEDRAAAPWATFESEADFLEMGTGLDAGDLDGDGLPDLVVGSRPTHPTSHVWVDFGPLGPAEGSSDDFDLDITFKESGYTICGQQPRILGDTDGDGVDDLLIGSGHVGDNEGRLWLAQGPLAPGEMWMADIPVSFSGEVDWMAGEAREAPGDLDGDGYADFVTAASDAPGADGTERRGAVYAWFGPFEDGDHPMAEAPVQFVGDARAAECGFAIAVGDLDQDGRMDLAVGCNASGAKPPNQVALFADPFGSASFTLDDAELLLSSNTYGFGSAVHIVDDVTGDGRPELILGDSGGDPARVDIYSGFPTL